VSIVSDLYKQIASLSGEKRRLFDLYLQKEGVTLSQLLIVAQERGSDHFPLSFAQQRLWFLDQLEPGNPLYNNPAAIRLTGPLDLAAMKQALNEIVGRHEILRTTFTTVGGQPVQVIAPKLILTLPVIDLRTKPEVEREDEVMRLATEEARKPFNLSEGPLLRVILMKLTEEEHVVLLTAHHIVSDGWSVGVLIREVAALYQAFTSGAPASLPELPIQYADFAVWQRQWLTGKRLDEQLAYWKQHLAGAAPTLELPADRPRPAAQTYRGATRFFNLPVDVFRALKELSRQNDATLFMTLLAAFQTLLYRYSGQEDFCVGAAVANRNRVETEGLIGFFVNMLALRCDLSGDPSFRQLLERARETTMGALAHQDLPFEMLVEELQPQRNRSHTPLFQVIFDLNNAAPGAIGALEFSNLKAEALQVEAGVAHADLVMSLMENGDALSGKLRYNTDIFDAATSSRMLEHFQVLLKGAVADPDRRVSDMPLLTEVERRRLLSEWNDTVSEYPRDKCVPELFEAQVERSPDAIALVVEEEELTYRELNRRANQLAAYLGKLGVGPETPVGFCLERSPEMVVGILGILKAGGTYVPLDPAYPKDRLAFMLEDTRTPVLLVQQRLIEHLPEHQARVVRMDGDWELIARENDANPASGATADHLAYVIYTSGSTGEPKGIAIPHRAINRLVFNTNYIEITPNDRMALASNSSFDAATFELWGALLRGARLVGISRDVALSPSDLAAEIRAQGISVMFLTTALFNQIAREVPAAFGSIRRLLFGGEAVDLHLVKEVLKHTPPARLLHVYGPTESTTFTTWYPTRGLPEDAATVPIGRPLANTEVYLLDSKLQPAPVGIAGELYIGGDGLAWGYLNQPELTTEKFIPNPYSGKGGGRLYKTGDQGRYWPDGAIEFLGRLDHQVKLRGFRIELGEIEAALNRHPSVRESVVLLREDAPGEKRLVAYLAIEPEKAFTVDDLRSFLRQKLPDYMTPAAFVTLDALPLTPNGKIDRRALPAPEQSRPELAEAFVAPRNPVEELLAGAWADVLEIERVGVHDNFFDLGGHSLLATKLFSRIRDAFQVGLPLAALFEAPTIAALAERIESEKREEQGASLPPLTPVAQKAGHLPLSYTQQRLWFLDQLEPGSSAYNIPAAVRLTGALDAEAFARSFNEIARRHESLRATFVTVNGQAAQLIAPAQPVDLPVTDLSGLPETRREVEATRMAAEEARRPFDLARGPVLRLRLLKLGDEEHIALMTMHHIISDGWSIGILIRELAALYEAFTAGRPSPLPELPIQYSDFAVWQQEWLQGEALRTQLAYWKLQLASLPILELPTDRPRPPVQTFRGAGQSLFLSAEQAESLKALSRREGVTLFMTLLAAFKTLLRHYTNQDDIVVGSDIANRNRRETEDLIGFFVNQLVLRTDLSGNPTFRELLGRVRAMTLEAFGRQDTPFGKLVEELQPQRDPSRNPLFQVMFIVQNAPMPELKLPGLTLTPLDVKGETSVFDLTLSFAEVVQGQLRVLCRYNTDLFEPDTIRRMLERLEALLDRIVARPEARLSALNIEAEAEAERREAEKIARPDGVSARLMRLMSVKPKTVSMSQERLVKLSYLNSERKLPLIAQPGVEGVDLVTWAGFNKGLIEEQLLKHGAILFRNFVVTSVTRFEQFTRTISPELMQYGERSSPRHKVSGSIYTSTDHPADQPIVLHNEQSYTLSWMMKLWFFCLQPANTGGGTPIADSRRIFSRLSPELVEKFEEQQVMYLRNYGAGLGLPWQEVFQTSERSEVEAYCRQAGIGYEWLDGERLRTRQIRPAIRRHPKTDEKVWFNHALFFHVSSLAAATRDSLLSGLKEEDLPFNTYYGDGSPFEAAVLSEIREAYRRETVSFPWQAGDILMVDNMLVAHGREPYTGQRQVVVAMAEPFNHRLEGDEIVQSNGAIRVSISNN
jgi:amino acid adenylation domain-containing protein